MDCWDVVESTTKVFNGEQTIRFATGPAPSLIVSVVFPDPNTVAQFCVCVYIHIPCHLNTKFEHGHWWHPRYMLWGTEKVGPVVPGLTHLQFTGEDRTSE